MVPASVYSIVASGPHAVVLIGRIKQKCGFALCGAALRVSSAASNRGL
jgi:hypothetical protein